GVELISHVAVAGRTTIGSRTRIWPFASVGHQPQDLKYAGEESRLEIGSDCMIREHATLNPGTSGGGMLTRVGDRCLFMMGSHVGHDCHVGSNVVLANNATLAGHVTIEDHVVLGGLSAVLQRMRVGEGAMVGGMAGVENDVIPFGSAIGNRADLGGLNLIGLKRRGVSRDEIHILRTAYKDIFEGPGTLHERTEAVARVHAEHALIRKITDFILFEPGRRFCTPRDL
ncbi:MAG: acyl-ACP--UDP-N-acetylglucosamine O-acyltransferase, partial [Pseudomonadota bacterium]